MTNLEDVLRGVERDVRSNGLVSESTCRAFADLPLHDRAAYEWAMRFLRCRTLDVPSNVAESPSAIDRIRASRLMLSCFFVQPDNPAWSSCLLDRLLEAVMGTPGGTVGDLLDALHEILGEPAIKLTETAKNLIKDLVVKTFTGNRASYDSIDFTEMIRKTTEGATPAQAYLVLLAVPAHSMPASCAIAILKRLEGTPYWGEAKDMLEGDLDESEPRDLGECEANRLRGAIQIGIGQADRGETAPLDVNATLSQVRSRHE